MKYLKSFEKVREMNILKDSIKRGDFTFFDVYDMKEYIDNSFHIFSVDDSLDIYEEIRDEWGNYMYLNRIIVKNGVLSLDYTIRGLSRVPARIDAFGSRYFSICLELYKKYTINIINNYEGQKEFLEEHPERFKELEYFIVNDRIREEYDYLWNADDIGLMSESVEEQLITKKWLYKQGWDKSKFDDIDIDNVFDDNHFYNKKYPTYNLQVQFWTHKSKGFKKNSSETFVISETRNISINENNNLFSIDYDYEDSRHKYENIDIKKFKSILDNILLFIQNIYFYNENTNVFDNIDIGYNFQYYENIDQYEEIIKFNKKIKFVKRKYDYLFTGDEMGLI